MDMDLSDDEREHLHAVVFDARGEERADERGPMSDMPRAAESARERDEEDMWAELG